MFAGIYSQLSPGGVCLTCTRPHVVQYPFFDAALEVWKRQQVSNPHLTLTPPSPNHHPIIT